MISPSFIEELERQRAAARADLLRWLTAGDESGVVAARARLADLDDISSRTVEQLVLTAS